MKFLFNKFLIILGFLFNGQPCVCKVRVVASTRILKGIGKSPAQPKYLKKIKKYLGCFANPDFEKTMDNLETIFSKNISNKITFSCFVRLIGKKTEKSGRIKQIEFFVNAKDSLRFLVKNRNNFNLNTKKNHDPFYEKTILLKRS